MAIKQHLGPTLTNLTREKEIKERRKGRERPSCAALGHNTKHPNKRGKEEKKEKKMRKKGKTLTRQHLNLTLNNPIRVEGKKRKKEEEEGRKKKEEKEKR